jgi:hypothetical protein
MGGVCKGVGVWWVGSMGTLLVVPGACRVDIRVGCCNVDVCV